VAAVSVGHTNSFINTYRFPFSRLYKRTNVIQILKAAFLLKDNCDDRHQQDHFPDENPTLIIKPQVSRTRRRSPQEGNYGGNKLQLLFSKIKF